MWESSEPAARTAALVAPAAVAAPAAQGEVALALLPDVIWRLHERRERISQAFGLCISPNTGALWGRTQLLRFSFVQGNWLNWLSQLDIPSTTPLTPRDVPERHRSPAPPAPAPVNEFAHLGNASQRADKANEVSLSLILTPLNGTAELCLMKRKASTSVTATAMPNAFILVEL